MIRISFSELLRCIADPLRRDGQVEAFTLQTGHFRSKTYPLASGRHAKSRPPFKPDVGGQDAGRIQRIGQPAQIRLLDASSIT